MVCETRNIPYCESCTTGTENDYATTIFQTSVTGIFGEIETLFIISVSGSKSVKFAQKFCIFLKFLTLEGTLAYSTAKAQILLGIYSMMLQLQLSMIDGNCLVVYTRRWTWFCISVIA